MDNYSLEDSSYKGIVFAMSCDYVITVLCSQVDSLCHPSIICQHFCAMYILNWLHINSAK